MRINVIGAGQMGSLYGAAALENGHDVYFVDASSVVVDALNKNGLIFERPDGGVSTYAARAFGKAPSDPADITLFMVKGWATEAAAELAQAGVSPSTKVVTLQNGLGNEEVLAQAFPTSPLFIGVSVHTVVTIAPGHYRQTGTRDTFVGPSSNATHADAELVATAFEHDQFPFTVLTEAGARREQWGKFVLNCASLPVTALTRLGTTEASAIPMIMDLMDRIILETCQIASAAGIDLNWEERAAFQRDLFATAGGRSSMLGDVLSGRRTEIESISGAALRKARQFGIDAPLTEMLYAMVSAVDVALLDRGGS